MDSLDPSPDVCLILFFLRNFFLVALWIRTVLEIQFQVTAGDSSSQNFSHLTPVLNALFHCAKERRMTMKTSVLVLGIEGRYATVRMYRAVIESEYHA